MIARCSLLVQLLSLRVSWPVLPRVHSGEQGTLSNVGLTLLLPLSLVEIDTRERIFLDVYREYPIWLDLSFYLPVAHGNCAIEEVFASAVQVAGSFKELSSRPGEWIVAPILLPITRIHSFKAIFEYFHI